MLMSMNVFHQTTPKLLSVSSHGRRRRIIPHSSSSSSHALVSSPATAVKFKPKFLHVHGIQHSSCNLVLASPATMEFNPKFLHFLPCHGFSHSSCKPVLGSSETMKFGPVLFALPRDNQEFSSDNKEEEIVQEHEEHCTSTSADNVHEEQLKKVSGTGEVKILDFEVREATPYEFRALDWLEDEGPCEYLSDDCYVYKRKQAEQDYELMDERYEKLALEPPMPIIAVRKEGMFKKFIGILHFHVKYHPKKHGIISNVIVAKSACQQVVGSKMLEFVFEHAKENGIPEVFLYVHRGNKPALALFEKMGFTASAAKATPLQEETSMYSCSVELTSSCLKLTKVLLVKS